MLYNNLPNRKRYIFILIGKVCFGFAREYVVIIVYINKEIVLFKITE